MRLALAGLLLVATNVVVWILFPFGDEGEAIMAPLLIAPAFAAGFVARRWAAIWFALIWVPTYLGLDSASDRYAGAAHPGESVVSAEELLMVILFIAALIALGVGLGKGVSRLFATEQM